jgi:acid phosphatase
MLLLAWCATVVALAGVQPPAAGAERAADSLVLNDAPLGNPAAELDPRGSVVLSGMPAAGPPFRCLFRFGFLDFPVPGDYAFEGPQRVQIHVGQGAEESPPLDRGRLVVEEFTGERIRLRLFWADERGESKLVADLRPTLRKVEPSESPPPRAIVPGVARDGPNEEDLVFCAVGNTGTGLPGQRAVAAAMAKLVDTGPLDFVLLVGNLFMPRGVSSIRDPQWRTKFEDVYPVDPFALTFHPVCGPMDRKGDASIPPGYGNMNPRWTMPRHTYEFTTTSHGKTFQFFAVDTWATCLPVKDARAREASRDFLRPLHLSKADWKIAFGHHALHPEIGIQDDLRDVLLERLRKPMEKYGVDVYISAERPHAQVFARLDGICHVVSGGGGGPEMADLPDWSENTLFALTGGSFVWFRFDGEALEISVRGLDGKAAFVHRLTKP